MDRRVDEPLRSWGGIAFTDNGASNLTLCAFFWRQDCRRASCLRGAVGSGKCALGRLWRSRNARRASSVTSGPGDSDFWLWFGVWPSVAPGERGRGNRIVSSNPSFTLLSGAYETISDARDETSRWASEFLERFGYYENLMSVVRVLETASSAS